MMFVFSTNLPGASCRITILTQSRRNWEGQGGNCHPNPHILKGINGIKEKILDVQEKEKILMGKFNQKKKIKHEKQIAKN